MNIAKLMRCASSLSSHRIWKPPVVSCSMHQRMAIILNVVSHPEKQFFNTNAGKLRPSIQSLQKRGHVECIRNVGSITQRQARAISAAARAVGIVYLGVSL